MAGALVVVAGIASAQENGWGKPGFYDKSLFKWSKQAPGYGPGVEFSEVWPRRGLVVGHRSVSSPFYAQLSFEFTKSMIAGGMIGDTIRYSFKAIKALTWAENMGKKGTEFDDFIPLGLCIGGSGKTKDMIGQFDPDTGIIGSASRSCHIVVKDGDGFEVEDLTDGFGILSLTPALATWVDQDTYKKHNSYLKAFNLGRSGKEICRIRFVDFVNKAKGWWNDRKKKSSNRTVRVPGAPKYHSRASSALPMLKTNEEILPGQIIGGKCVVAYKDPILGQRHATESVQYEVLLAQDDYTMSKMDGKPVRLRGDHPVAIQHVESGLCLAVRGEGAALSSCFKKDNIKGVSLDQPPFNLGWDGTLRVRNDSVSGCIIAQNTPHGIQTGNCGLDPHFKWFLTRDGHLASSWLSCMGVAKSNQKPGGIVELKEDCAQKLGKAYQWRLLPYQKLTVKRTGNLNGQISVTSALNPKSSFPYDCLKGGCTKWYRSGETLSLTAKPIGGDEVFTKFGAWKGAGCKAGVNPCTLKVGQGKSYNVSFSMASAFKSAKLPQQFRVETGGKCLTVTGSTGRPALTACREGDASQIFQPKFKGKAGWLRASFMGNPQCIYHENRNGMVEGMGLFQGPCGGKLRSGMDQPNWSFEQSGHIRPKAWKHCLEPKGDAVIYRQCGHKSPDQLWKFAAVKPPVEGELLQVSTSGRCMDNKGLVKAGPQMHQWTCSKKNLNQRFTLLGVRGKNGVFEIRSNKSDLCLDVEGESKANGGKIVQWSCHGKNNQAWKKIAVKNDWFQLQSLHSGKCIDIAQGSKDNGGDFHQWSCDNKNRNQLFRLAATVADNKIKSYAAYRQTAIDPGLRTLVMRHSGKCVDNTASKSKGAWVHQWDCNPKNVNQQFDIIAVAKQETYSPEYLIKSRRSGMCLDVAGAKKDNGTAVVQWPCDRNKKNQRWTFLNDEKSGYWSNIFSVHAGGKCLDSRGATMKNGAKFQIWKCVLGVEAQSFRPFR